MKTSANENNSNIIVIINHISFPGSKRKKIKTEMEDNERGGSTFLNTCRVPSIGV